MAAPLMSTTSMGAPAPATTLLHHFRGRLVAEVERCFMSAASVVGDDRDAELRDLYDNMITPIPVRIAHQLWRAATPPSHVDTDAIDAGGASNLPPPAPSARFYFQLVSEFFAAAAAAHPAGGSLRTAATTGGTTAPMAGSPLLQGAGVGAKVCSDGGGGGVAAGEEVDDTIAARRVLIALRPHFDRLWSNDAFARLFALLFHGFLLQPGGSDVHGEGEEDGEGRAWARYQAGRNVANEYIVLLQGCQTLLWADVCACERSMVSIYTRLLGMLMLPPAHHPPHTAASSGSGTAGSGEDGAWEVELTPGLWAMPPRLRVSLHELVMRYFLYYESPATLPACLHRVPHPQELLHARAHTYHKHAPIHGHGQEHATSMTTTTAATAWSGDVDGGSRGAPHSGGGRRRSGGKAAPSWQPAVSTTSTRLAHTPPHITPRQALNIAAAVREWCALFADLAREDAVLVYLQALRVVFGARGDGGTLVPGHQAATTQATKQAPLALPLDPVSANRLSGALLELATPGGPLYPSRPVRHAAQATLDAIFPNGRLIRRVVHLAFRLLHPMRWPESMAHWCRHQVSTAVMAVPCCWARRRGVATVSRAGDHGGGEDAGQGGASPQVSLMHVARRSYSVRVLAAALDGWLGSAVAAVPVVSLEKAVFAMWSILCCTGHRCHRSGR